MHKVRQAMQHIPHLHVPSTTGTAGLTGAASIGAPLDSTTIVDSNLSPMLSEPRKKPGLTSHYTGLCQ